MKKILNGELVDLTQEELNQIEIDKVKTAEDKEKRQAKEQALNDLKASAKQKLMNGEALTADEANVMVGL